MKLRTITGALSAAICATPMLLGYASPAQAGPDDGVRCPTNYTSTWNSDTKVLRCSRDNTTPAVTACPVSSTPAFIRYHQRNGRDRCTAPSTTSPEGLPQGLYANAVCSVAGYEYVNDGGTGNLDRCTKTEKQYAYPNQL